MIYLQGTQPVQHAFYQVTVFLYNHAQCPSHSGSWLYSAFRTEAEVAGQESLYAKDRDDLLSRDSTCTTRILSSDCFPVQPCTMPFPFRQLVVFCIQNWGRGSWTGVSLRQRSWRSTVKGLNLDNMHFIKWLFFCTTMHNALSIQAVSWRCSAFRTEAEVAGQESLSMPKVPSITTVLKWLAHGLNLVHGPPCATSMLLTSLPFCPDHCH